MSYMTNSEVGHAWYYNRNGQQGDTPNNKNFFYNGDTIYSYGAHYPIAKKCDGHVLMTVDSTCWPTCSSYGSTTSQHVSLTRRAIPSNATIIFVEDVAAQSKKDHMFNYKREMQRIQDILQLISTGRNGSGAQDDRIKAIHEIVTGMNLYTRIYKLGKRQMVVENLLDQDTLAKMKAAAKKRAAKKRAADQLQQERTIARNKQTIDDWKNGITNNMPYSIKKVYLRITGDDIETSQGARISVKHAVKLFAYVCSICKNGQSFKARHFGSFELLSVDKACTIKIGCHTIELDEMQRINSILEG